MTIILASDKYRFDGGKAALLRRDWAENVNNSDRSALLTADCTDNRINGVKAEGPAEYGLFLVGATVECRPWRVRRRFVTLEPWTVPITSEDIERDQCIAHVPDADLFLLSFSQDGKPLRNGRVTVYLEMRSSEITTDEGGTVSVLGDPRTHILAVGEGCILGYQINNCIGPMPGRNRRNTP